MLERNFDILKVTLKKRFLKFCIFSFFQDLKHCSSPLIHVLDSWHTSQSQDCRRQGGHCPCRWGRGGTSCRCSRWSTPSCPPGKSQFKFNVNFTFYNLIEIKNIKRSELIVFKLKESWFDVVLKLNWIFILVQISQGFQMEIFCNWKYS